MSKIYEIPANTHIQTAYGNFYKKIKDEGLIDQFHQLFTYACLVGLKENNTNNDKKTNDIFQVQNIDDDNLKIIKGIALVILDVNDSQELINELKKYADGGIELLKKDYENDKTLSLSKYIN
jgi:hypothetical protein